MDASEFWETFHQLFGNIFAQIALTLLIILIAQLIFRATIDRIVRRVVRGHHFDTMIDEKKREDTLANIFHTALAVLIWTVGIIIVLWLLEINLAALVTGAGLLGIIVGFGAQATIKDFLAGIFIISENQYRVGDVVTLELSGTNVSGEVEEITIRITRLRDIDGNLVTVSNGSITTVTNLTFKFANVNVDLRISYDADIDKVEEIINKVGSEMANDKDWEEGIFEPIQFLRVESFEESAVIVKALGKVEPAAQWELAGEFRRRIKKAFERNNIRVPYPQMIVRSARVPKKVL
jgi:moderate conductance mechanosensitive channel